MFHNRRGTAAAKLAIVLCLAAVCFLGFGPTALAAAVRGDTIAETGAAASFELLIGAICSVTCCWLLLRLPGEQ